MGKKKVKTFAELEAKRKAELKQWLRRPMWPDHKLAEAEPISSPFLDDGESEAERQQKFFAERREFVRVKLRWSKKRLASFEKLFVDYKRSSSVTTYLKIRRTFPQMDIFVPRFLNLSFSDIFEDELNRLRIPRAVINRAQDAHSPAVDAMCLHLLELLAERDALPNSGRGYIEQRRASISDAMVNYLLLTILESFPLNEAIFIPSSLVHLIRRQLSGEYPDLYETFQTRVKRFEAVIIANDALDGGEQLSVRKAAKMLKVPRSTAARWLASKAFRDAFNEEREFRMKHAASLSRSPEGAGKGYTALECPTKK